MPEQPLQANSKNEKIEKRRRGIEGVRNLSFITGLILQFLENSKFKELLASLNIRDEIESNDSIKENKTYLTIILSYISRLMRANMRVDPRDIVFMVDAFFPNFRNFDMTQINSVKM